MVARGMRDHAAARLGLLQGKDSVHRAAELESPHALEVLALEEEAAATQGVHGPACKDGCAMRVRGDSPRRGPDVFDGWPQSCSRGSGSLIHDCALEQGVTGRASVSIRPRSVLPDPARSGFSRPRRGVY